MEAASMELPTQLAGSSARVFSLHRLFTVHVTSGKDLVSLVTFLASKPPVFREFLKFYEPLPSKRECLNSRELAAIGNLTVMVQAEMMSLELRLWCVGELSGMGVPEQESAGRVLFGHETEAETYAGETYGRGWVCKDAPACWDQGQRPRSCRVV